MFGLSFFLLEKQSSTYRSYIYMLFAGWEVRMVTVFHYTDRPKPVNNLFIFSSLSNDFVYSREKTHASVTVTVVRDRKIPADRAKNQSDCRIRYRDRLEKIKWIIKRSNNDGQSINQSIPRSINTFLLKAK